MVRVTVPHFTFAANLLLARATARDCEVGTRLAIGARRWRILRLLLTENLILGFLAAGLGVMIAIMGHGSPSSSAGCGMLAAVPSDVGT